MVKQQCLFGTLLSIKVPGRHFLVNLFSIILVSFRKDLPSIIYLYFKK
ncbi:hypothetical protein GPK88_18745 [Blautia sp. MCC269]|nr:hypothetical protein [Blautia sp. MCC269]